MTLIILCLQGCRIPEGAMARFVQMLIELFKRLFRRRGDFPTSDGFEDPDGVITDPGVSDEPLEDTSTETLQ